MAPGWIEKAKLYCSLYWFLCRPISRPFSDEFVPCVLEVRTPVGNQSASYVRPFGEGCGVAPPRRSTDNTVFLANNALRNKKASSQIPIT
jgi:hypothetical protein